MYSVEAAEALWAILRARQASGRGMDVLEIRRAETRMAKTMLCAALGAQYCEEETLGLLLKQWQLPNGQLPASVIEVRELRLPDFNGDCGLLAVILDTFGPALHTLEVSVLNTSILKFAEAPSVPMGGTVSFARVAQRCSNLTTLCLGDMVGETRPLGLYLVKAASLLRRLFLESLTDQLNKANCNVMDLLRAANVNCPGLEEIYMIDCLVTGESSELFTAVGKRLRTFTGIFSWETSDELIDFSDLCPNVQSLSLHCSKDQFGPCCDEGAVLACQRFGTNLRSLVVSHYGLSPDSLAKMLCAATQLEELELMLASRPSIELVDTILSAVGGSLRSFTFAWPENFVVEDANNGASTVELLGSIGRYCPLLESLWIPHLGSTVNFSTLTAVQNLVERLQFLDIFDCKLDDYEGYYEIRDILYELSGP